VTKTDSLGSSQSAHFVDIYSEAYDNDVHAAHRAAREAAWYATTPMGVMAVRYAEVNSLLKDRRLGELGGQALIGVGITDGPLWDWWNLMLFSKDGEEHLRLRRLIAKAFTPRKIEQMRTVIKEIANGLIDKLDGQERCEFVTAFAAPFAVAVIGHLLGIKESDYDQFYQASSDLALAFTGQIGEQRERIEGGLAVLNAYADELIAERRQHPTDDLVSDLIAAEEAGDRLSGAELQMLITILIFGGLDHAKFRLGIYTGAEGERFEDAEGLPESSTSTSAEAAQERGLYSYHLADVASRTLFGVAAHDATEAELPGLMATVGVAIALPAGYAAFVHPRSGLAARHGITVLNAPGTVDAGYRGEILVNLLNTDTQQAFTIARGDRIAQLVVQRVSEAHFVEVRSLPGSQRGDNGHGASGGFGTQNPCATTRETSAAHTSTAETSTTTKD